jgi:hypothetical protein
MRDARTRRMALAWAVLALGAAVGRVPRRRVRLLPDDAGPVRAVAFTLALPALRSAFAALAERGAPRAPVLWAALLLGAAAPDRLALDDSQAVQRDSLRFVHRNFSPDRAGFQPETALFCGVRQPIGLWFSQRIYQTFEGPQPDDEVTAADHALPAPSPPLLPSCSSGSNLFRIPCACSGHENYQPYRDSVFVARPGGSGRRRRDRELRPARCARYRWLPIGEAVPIEVDGRPSSPVRDRARPGTTRRGSPPTARGPPSCSRSDEPPSRRRSSFYKAY